MDTGWFSGDSSNDCFGARVMATTNDLEARLNTHEAVCAERWTETILRIKRIEHILIGAAGAIILLLLGIVLKVH